jgi:hypothetical protein
MDGKHIVLQSRVNRGSDFFKSQYSALSFYLVGGNYSFLFMEVGCQGRISDGGVFRICELVEEMEKDSSGFPPPAPITG